jgi:hypothetical protein
MGALFVFCGLLGLHIIAQNHFDFNERKFGGGREDAA